MKKIQILDCTLRDGGYVNDWRFGVEATAAIKNALRQTGVTITELGFFRNEAYNPNRTIFNHPDQVEAIAGSQQEDTFYAAIVEMANYFPEDKLPPYSGGKLKAIRYSFWKRLIDDAFDYCSMIKEKGYLLCCQPTRAEQYTEKDFAEMCQRFSRLNPYAIYIVDTFGLLTKQDVVKYAKVANDNLPDGIVLGYHAHNNMGQAFDNAKAFIELNLGDRTKQIDATIGGLGRGAGNLHLEQLLQYLNEACGTAYDLAPVLDVCDRYIMPIKQVEDWGYNSVYHLVAQNHCNPNYANFFLKNNLSDAQVEKALSFIQGENKYLYSDEKAENYLRMV